MSQVTGSPCALASPDRLDRRRGRDMGNVIARAGDRDEAQVALDHDDFGRRRDPGEAEPGGDLALVDLAGAGRGSAPRDAGSPADRSAGISSTRRITSALATAFTPSVKPSAPFAASRPISVSSLAGEPLGRRGIGVDLGELDLARPPGEELDDRDVVDRRLGVGQRDHRRDPAGRGGPAAALDRFHVLGAGLAQLHAHVDEPGREAQPVGIARSLHVARSEMTRRRRGDAVPSTSRSPIASSPLSGSSSRAPAEAGDAVPRIVRGSFHRGRVPLPRSRARISRQAMRTATPIST